MGRKIEVKIYQNGLSGCLEIGFVEVRGEKYYIAKPVELIFKEAKPGQIVEPTLCLPFFLGNNFLNAFAEELDKQGIKTDKDAKIEGTLESTRYHLEDLRTLLKLKKR